MTRIDRFALALGRLAAWAFAAIILLMVYEVVARYVFHSPTIWAHEVSVALASFAFVFGGAYCMAEGSHMRIGFFVDPRPRLARLSRWLGIGVGAVYLSGLAFAAFRQSERAIFRFALDGSWNPERSGSTLNSPLPAYLKGLLFLGAILFLAVLLRQALRRAE
ncbi:TRAP transporter small permease subunit [Rhodobacterales bacterium HKCCE3408]|nr:TRAP transporter small permease subunit [Rhodobacterales bacterium HKCCE3408]